MNATDRTMSVFKGGLNCSQAVVCRELLGRDIGTPEGLEEAKRRDVHNTVCTKLVRDAGEILEELL